ncbi:MAG: phage major tail tube protein [Lachnospiraceae bacterium]|nr:phage major tail tube protein [Lachnospiraceae bacterium]
MKYNQIPDKINNFNVYHGEVTDDSRLMGVTNEVTLPTFTLKSETLNLAGFAGDLDSPTEGQFESSQIEIPFSNVSKQSMAILEDDTKPVVLRGAQEFIDKETGTKKYINRTITIRGMTKAVNMGSLVVGGYGNPTVTKEVTYYKDVVDGETLFEMDKINYKYVVNGVDKGAQIADLI